MILHHVTTLALLAFSYMENMVPIGALVALVHDVSDVPLEVCHNRPQQTVYNLPL